MKSLAKFFFATALAGVIAVLLVVQWPVPLSEPKLLVRIPQGASLRAAAHSLNEGGVGIPAWIISGVGRVAWLSTSIKAGNESDQGIALWALLRKLSSGDTSQADVLFVEGTTFRDISTKLIMIKLGATGQSPASWFFPDIYRFDKRSEDLAVLQRAFLAMQKQLNAVWQSRESNLPLKLPYELLILASIVEKETGAARPIGPRSPGVFINRLRKGMRLQTDPTVIYGLGDRFDGNLRKADLQRDTPHNTYTRGGLPPTPICMPGIAALQAVAHPAKNGCLVVCCQGRWLQSIFCHARRT
ncbi:MAG: Murein endolytic transglycosylase MltG [Fluviibacter phosphoraccumulans EoVTN8]